MKRTDFFAVGWWTQAKYGLWAKNATGNDTRKNQMSQHIFWPLDFTAEVLSKPTIFNELLILALWIRFSNGRKASQPLSLPPAMIFFRSCCRHCSLCCCTWVSGSCASFTLKLCVNKWNCGWAWNPCNPLSRNSSCSLHRSPSCKASGNTQVYASVQWKNN